VAVNLPPIPDVLIWLIVILLIVVLAKWAIR
jgi:hypothetical protein